MTARYLGIDPGINGGLAWTCSNGEVGAESMPKTEKDVWEWITKWNFAETITHNHRVFAAIEQQTPRPTSIFDRKAKEWRATILKSTCLLWGNYCQLRAWLIAAGIPFEDCPPKRWQQGLHIRPKDKEEPPRHWKNHLKAEAQSLFPDAKVTLATSDALLLAEWCRRWREGKL